MDRCGRPVPTNPAIHAPMFPKASQKESDINTHQSTAAVHVDDKRQCMPDRREKLDSRR